MCGRSVPATDDQKCGQSTIAVLEGSSGRTAPSGLRLEECLMVNLNWWIYFQNVQSGMLLDVQGNRKTAGASVWPYALNYTNAQIFRVGDTRQHALHASTAKTRTTSRR